MSGKGHRGLLRRPSSFDESEHSFSVGFATRDSIPRLTRSQLKAAIKIQALARGRQARQVFAAKKSSSKMLTYFCIYVVFYLLVVCCALLQIDQLEFFMVDQLRDLIVDEEFLSSDTHIYKSFNDVATPEEFWQFIQGPFMSNMFPDSCYEDAANVTSCGGVINFNNVIVGGIRLRQFRTRWDECAGDDIYPDRRPNATGDRSDACNARYVKRSTIEEQWRNRSEVFSEDEIDRRVPANAAACFKSTPVGFASFSAATGARYSSAGGFTCDLLVMESKADITTRLQQLKDFHWVSKETRVVIIELTVYNSNINRFATVRLALELVVTGGVIVWSEVASVMLDPTREPFPFSILFYCIYGVALLMVIVYLVQEVLEILDLGPRRYFCSGKDGFWNIMVRRFGGTNDRAKQRGACLATLCVVGSTAHDTCHQLRCCTDRLPHPHQNTKTRTCRTCCCFCSVSCFP